MLQLHHSRGSQDADRRNTERTTMDPHFKILSAKAQIENVTKLLNGKHVLSIRVDSSGNEERAITITYPAGTEKGRDHL